MEVPIGREPATSENASALDDADDDEYDRRDKQHVNEAAHGHGADQSERPENQQDERDCPKHVIPPGESSNPPFATFGREHRSRIERKHTGPSVAPVPPGPGDDPFATTLDSSLRTPIRRRESRVFRR